MNEIDGNKDGLAPLTDKEANEALEQLNDEIEELLEEIKKAKGMTAMTLEEYVRDTNKWVTMVMVKFETLDNYQKYYGHISVGVLLRWLIQDLDEWRCLDKVTDYQKLYDFVIGLVKEHYSSNITMANIYRFISKQLKEILNDGE